MLLFLLNNWKWLLPGLMALGLGTALVVTKLELSALRVEVASQAAQAATTLATETAKAAAADSRAAEFANKLDTEHAKALADIDATRADFANRLRIAAGRACHTGSTAAQAVNSRVGENPPAGSDSQFRGPDLEAGQRLRDYALSLQQYALTCHAWAVEVGR